MYLSRGVRGQPTVGLLRQQRCQAQGHSGRSEPRGPQLWNSHFNSPRQRGRVFKVESECLTFDLLHVALQLLPGRSQLLPLSQQPTSSLLQLLVQLQVLTGLLEPQVHVAVRGPGRVWGANTRTRWLNTGEPEPDSSVNTCLLYRVRSHVDDEASPQTHLVQSSPGCWTLGRWERLCWCPPGSGPQRGARAGWAEPPASCF